MNVGDLFTILRGSKASAPPEPATTFADAKTSIDGDSRAPLVCLSLVEFFDEAALLDLTQQALIDKRLRIGGLGFGIIFFDKTEHSFNAAQRRVRDRLVVFVD